MMPSRVSDQHLAGLGRPGWRQFASDRLPGLSKDAQAQAEEQCNAAPIRKSDAKPLALQRAPSAAAPCRTVGRPPYEFGK